MRDIIWAHITGAGLATVLALWAWMIYAMVNGSFLSGMM